MKSSSHGHKRSSLTENVRLLLVLPADPQSAEETPYGYICITGFLLKLNNLGEFFSRQYIEILFLYFPRKQYEISYKLSPLEDNLHEMPNPVF